MRHMVKQEVGRFLGKASGGYNSTSSVLHPLALLLLELKINTTTKMKKVCAPISSTRVCKKYKFNNNDWTVSHFKVVHYIHSGHVPLLMALIKMGSRTQDWHVQQSNAFISS